MKFFRQHIIFRILCVVLALHVFNISVDAPDAQPDHIAEDLSINDQESFVELILEKVLGIDNAIAEHDEPDERDSGNFEMAKDFKVYANPVSANFSTTSVLIRLAVTPYKDSFYSSHVNEITPPPPKA